MSCSEFKHFRDELLNSQHHEIIKTIDILILQLKEHDKYERENLEKRSDWNRHHKSHLKTLKYVQKLRQGLINHINTEDIQLFD
jgi:hypothetical protein